MAQPRDVDPVKLFVAILWAGEEALGAALERLRVRWGTIDFVGADHFFDLTDYYEPEMGPGLRRRLVSFEPLVPPGRLVEAKHESNAVEAELAAGRGRRVNLDVGYLDLHKIVLGSFKGAGQKLYLADGVWADLAARYRAGRYQPFEWTFPDFSDGRYDGDLAEIRARYRRQLAALGRRRTSPP